MRIVIAASAAVVLCACQSAGGVGQTVENATVVAANSVGVVAVGGCRLLEMGSASIAEHDVEVAEALAGVDEQRAALVSARDRYRERGESIDGVCLTIVDGWEVFESAWDSSAQAREAGYVLLEPSDGLLDLIAKSRVAIVEVKKLADKWGIDTGSLIGAEVSK